jgi:molybdopterin-guanine dinucleotide biosynthesis protein A
MRHGCDTLLLRPVLPVDNDGVRVPPLAGLVLAGGRSSRMGRDKALLPVGGQPLLVSAVRFLRAFCAPVLIAGGSADRTAALLRLPGLGRADGVADQGEDGAGPLAGLTAGLERAPAGLVAVLAVDLPAPSRPVLELLADRWAGEVAVVPEVGGRLEPLHAVWSTTAAAPLRERLVAGRRSVTQAAQVLGARIVPLEGGFARNLNRPEDLEG